MSFKNGLKVAEKFLVDNSPGILTGLGVAGTITTAVLAGKAAYSSAFLIQQENMMNKSTALSYEEIDGRTVNQLGAKKTVELVWKEYIPAAIALTATVTSIVMANQVSTRRAAAIAAAFKLSEQMSEEYREKIVKTLGKKKEEEARSELAAERISKVADHGTIIIAGGQVMFYDELSGRIFSNDVETVRKAVNDINHKVNNYMHASLSDFYDLIGLKPTGFSDEIGWNTDELLEVEFVSTLVDERTPAISISYNNTPIRGFDRCN